MWSKFKNLFKKNNNTIKDDRQSFVVFSSNEKDKKMFLSTGITQDWGYDWAVSSAHYYIPEGYIYIYIYQ